MNWNNKTLWIVGIGLVFALIYASLYFSLSPGSVDNNMWIFNTPDETANYFFISNLLENNSLVYYEELNSVSGDLNLVHPRSTTVVGDHIAPGSFLGFILVMGAIGNILGLGVIPFVIPIFSVLAAVCFYHIISKIFNERISIISTILLFITPAFWYYNSRSLFNNVLFIDFIIIGFWFLFNFFKSKKQSFLISSGIILGVALSMRMSDTIWVAILALSVFIYNIKKSQWKDWFIMAGSVVVGVVPVLALQSAIYGHIFVTGYTPQITERLSGGGFYVNLLKQVVAPFGFNLVNVLSNFYYFFVDMFFVPFYLSAIGMVLLAVMWRQKKLNKKIKYYLVVTVVVSVFVSIYYGSFKFFDNLIGAPLIGSSQTRYMLPIYILSIPAMAYTIDWLSSRFKNINIRYVFIGLVLVLLTGFSAHTVLLSGPESLWKIKDTVIGYHDINKQVMSMTEDDAVIVTSYNDKVFFPNRKIIFYWQEQKFIDNIALISTQVPVYFYSTDWQNDINYMIDNSFLESELIVTINEREALYRLW